MSNSESARSAGSLFFSSRKVKVTALGLSMLTIAVLGVLATRKGGSIVSPLPIMSGPKEFITKDRLAQMLAEPAAFYQFPTEVDLPDQLGKGVIQYGFDPKLQDEMVELFRQYHPDYGAFVAMDATTGQVLSVVSYTDSPEKGAKPENLALRATFPSASVFKVVTAAAAIENNRYTKDTMISFNGANHTLYRRNIVNNPVNRWTRSITLKDAFAKSVNTVFGRIGAFTVGHQELKEYAGRFGFNRPITADVPVQPGKAPIPDDAWGLAETASGYTRENTMSPIQGAMIAAAVVNNGVIMEPYFVQSVYTAGGKEIYAAKPKIASTAIDPSTAAEMRELMRETVLKGTSKKSFKGFTKSKYGKIDVGGKTGSLTGMDPAGKYDWFVGFAQSGDRRIAFASVTIHKKLWRVKSSYVVRRAIEAYFR